MTSQSEDTNNEQSHSQSQFGTNASNNGQASESTHSVESSSHNETEMPESFPDFMPAHPAVLKTELLCLACFCVTILIFRFSAITNIGSHFLGGYQADAGLYVWLMKSNVRDLFSLSWYNTSAFHPYTQTLAWSDNFILPSMVAAPFILLGAPYAFAYNFVLLLATLLNGYCTYRLCHRLTGVVLPSLGAGLLFMLSAPLTAQMGHPQLIFAFWIPLGITLFLSFLGSPNLLRATLSALAVTGAFLTTVYYSLFLIIVFAALLFMQQILRPFQLRRNHLFLLATGGIIGGIPLIPFALPYLNVRDLFGKREIYESFYFSATGLSYLSFSPLHRLYAWTSSISHAEAYLGCGLVLLVCAGKCFLRLVETKRLRALSRLFLGTFVLTVLFSSTKPLCASEACVAFRANGYAGYLTSFFLWTSLVSLVLLFRKMGKLEQKLGVYIMTNRALIAVFLFVAYLFFAISLGPLGNPTKHQWATGPFRLFYEFLPGFNSVRAISRAGIVVICCLCVLFAFAMQFLSKRATRYRQILAILFAIGLLEGLHQTFPLEPSTPSSLAFEQLKEKLNEHDVVAVLPLTSELKENYTVKHWSNFAKLNVQYLHWLFPAGARSINGYSGQRSKVMLEYPRKLSGFPDRRSLNALKLIQGTRFIIYCSQFVPDFNSNEFLQRAALYPELEFLYADEEGNYLFELKGELELVDRYFLRTPSYPQSFLHIELMASEQPAAPEYSVTIHEHDHFQDARIAQLKLPADGKWQQYSLPLPRANNKARPFRLSFKKEGEVTIFMRSNKMSPIEEAR